MEGAIFDNLENEVIYHDPNDDMVNLVMRLWDASDPAKKWEMLHYDIKMAHSRSSIFIQISSTLKKGAPTIGNAH